MPKKNTILFFSCYSVNSIVYFGNMHIWTSSINNCIIPCKYTDMQINILYVFIHNPHYGNIVTSLSLFIICIMGTSGEGEKNKCKTKVNFLLKWEGKILKLAQDEKGGSIFTANLSSFQVFPLQFPAKHLLWIFLSVFELKTLSFPRNFIFLWSSLEVWGFLCTYVVASIKISLWVISSY